MLLDNGVGTVEDRDKVKCACVSVRVCVRACVCVCVCVCMLASLCFTPMPGLLSQGNVLHCFRFLSINFYLLNSILYYMRRFVMLIPATLLRCCLLAQASSIFRTHLS